MNVYASDDEQAEALKAWWKENGRSVIGGLVLGLGGVFGWQSWQEHQHGQVIQASNSYAQLAQAAQVENVQEVAQLRKYLSKAHAGSVYEFFGSLQMARVSVNEGKLDEAAALLRGALAQTDDPSLQQIARLRLARLLLAQNQLDQLEGVLNEAGDDAFRGEFNALRGDLAMRRNQLDEARAAYRAAIDEGAGNSSILRLKLDDLGEA